MKKLPDGVINFLQNQGYVIVSTVDKAGSLHNSCKGIVDIKSDGKVYLLDLYKGKTFENLKNNPHISITAVDEHSFVGYCLKGKARIVTAEEVSPRIIKAWEDKIASRLTRRVIKNIHEEKGQLRHPEALLPKPKYLIAIEAEEIIDLTPRHLK